jgi:3-keto-5-aminohexanoate cleavage enzyme
VIGIGRFQTPIAVLAIILGGHVRVGMEDNPYLDLDGTFARSNAELVDKIVRIARDLGRDIASPVEARKITGLVA